MEDMEANVNESNEIIADVLPNTAEVNGSESIQIAPTEDTNRLGKEEDPMLFIELGDRIVIDAKQDGRTTGTVYYRDGELIRVKPDGVSNRLRDFVVNNEGDQETYEEEIIAAYVIEKRKFDSFVEQQDFHVGQLIDTFTAEGSRDLVYKVIKVDAENDMITLQEGDDSEVTKDLLFEFTGIPREEDFIMIAITSYAEDKADATNEVADQDASNEEEPEEPEEEAIIVGYIEVAIPRVFREAASYEQSIPDTLQKMDAMNDFLSSLDAFLQKDPKAIRNVRILVETLFYLKQQTIRYGSDGSIELQPSSAETLGDLIQQTPIPLGRAILNVSKKEYETEALEEGQDFEYVYFENFDSELLRIISDSDPKVHNTKPWKWVNLQSMLSEDSTPWKASDRKADGWNAIVDSDFFRLVPPVEEGNILPGYEPSHDKEIPPTFGEVPFGLERALGATYRKGTERNKDLLLSEEKANMTGYLLFPTHLADYLGSTRSYHLAVDSGRSQLPPKTMKTIIKETGVPVENATSKDIYFLNLANHQLANIPLDAYIDGISVPALGLGDTFATLQQYGMENMELNEKVVAVLLKKISSYQSQLLSSLAKLRAMIQQQPREPTMNPFLSDPTFLTTIRGEDTLVQDLLEFDRVNPSLVGSDLGMVSHLLRRHANYFQVAAGGNSVLIAKALYHSTRNDYLHQLMIATTLRLNDANRGERPKRNPCRHVADLVSVRRIRDDAERFEQLSNVFRMYQGNRDQNWIDCTICKEHLLCVHERLQLQAYLNPKEKGVLEKEIILKCSGGQFQGKYICRNCGQSIRELDFDNNMEFDDDGKPKSGRSVLVDEGAVLEEKLDMMTGVPIEPPEQVRLHLSAYEKKYYSIIRIISTKLGIQFDQEGYRRAIEYVVIQSHIFPTAETHAIRKAANPAIHEYAEEMARLQIAACGCAILIEVQTKFPPYPIHYVLPGCTSTGFDGYPLIPEMSEVQGLMYIACGIASIRMADAPWITAGFQKQSDMVKRVKGIFSYLVITLVGREPKVMAKGMATTDMVQSRLQSKRKYLSDLEHHDSNYPMDQIFASFLPEQVLLRKEDAAKEAIIPEVAEHSNRGQHALMKLWIRQAHHLAQKTVSLIRGSPLLEATCCTVPIRKPESFWSSQDELPELAPRRLRPNQQGSFLLTEFHPREAEVDVVEPEKELYYRLFLKCCYDGPRKGHAHELGLTNHCTWCGFQFPEHPLIRQPIETKKEGTLAEETASADKAALAEQEINTDTNAFVDLLDTIHAVNHVESVDSPHSSSMEEVFVLLADVKPIPVATWPEIMAQTIVNMEGLPARPESGDILQATALLSDATSAQRKSMKERLPEQATLLDEIIKLSWVDFFTVLRVYFIVPFKRLLSSFDQKNWKIPPELLKELSALHVKDLQPILTSEMSVVDKKREPMHVLAEEVVPLMSRYVAQMSALLPFMNTIRAGMVPGGSTTLRYIQRALFYGPLGDMVNASARSSSALAGDPIQFLLELIAESLEKFRHERMSYDEKTVRERIAVRDEKERTNVIKDFDKLTPEERAVELMNKKLGLGKWAVGGTKLIYAYDKDYYDLERQKRMDAGIVDFPGQSTGEMPVPEGGAVDEIGMPEYEGEEDGYEFNQHGDDDNE